MEQNEMTIKDALMVAYNELCEISVPAEQTFSIGVHVGKTLMILKDCIDSIEREEKSTEKKDTPDVDEIFKEEPKPDEEEAEKDDA